MQDNVEIGNNFSGVAVKPGTGFPRIIIAGGGTGGHIFPAIAIANALKKMQPNTEILFVGAKDKMEMEKVPLAGYNIEGIDIAGFNRSSLIKNVGLPYKLVKSFLQVRDIIRLFKPGAAVGVGGYSSFPVLKYAQSRGIKTFIHESNAFAGKANAMLGKKATRVFVSAHGMEKFFPSERLLLTGNPVRASITDSKITKEDAIRFFQLDPYKKTVLSIGGSLGAKNINKAVAANIDAFEQNNLQLIWQTGKPFAAEARELADGKANVWVNDFITQMEYAYAAADVVISRSGAMSIAELCIMEKPAVFVPYPFAAEDHQTANALNLVNHQAGLLVHDKDAIEKLIPTVIDLMKDEERQEHLRLNIGTLAMRNADDVIAKDILNLL
ncbi:MAG: undecaprenyldiphospho-muramoylpentapeptide beta-N-acetylglucosaminyltransferase [Ferruginibacter sp.]|nr:undecaprenyldiphospho-muramoylpentapeptide beta-N-acetylglucosaminyltransferase [Ferruginibacter sp.]